MEQFLKVDTQFYNNSLPNPTPSEVYKPFTIKTYDDEGYTIRNIELIDAHIKNYSEVFGALENNQGSSNKGMFINIKVVSAIQRINDSALNVFRWHYSDYGQEAYHPPVYTDATEEKEKEPFRIDLDAKSSDVKNGVFGFDKIPYNYKSICQSDIEQLRSEYNPIAPILDKEYLPPWVSIRKGQTIELKLGFKKEGNAKAYSKIAFESHPDFSISPADLKNASTVQITCNATNPQPAQLLIKADGLIIGALNVFYPKPKRIDLEWFFVEITGDKADGKDLQRELTKNKLETLLQKGMNPALIDINLKNEEATIVNLESKKEYFNTNGIIKKTEKHHYIENSRKHFFVAALNSMHKIDPTIVSLFLVNRSCLTTGATGEDGGAFEAVAGFSPTNTGRAYGILNQKGNLLPTAIIHEVMHALGLQHTFSTETTATHTFSKQKTKNYMDYSPGKDYTWQWQWNKLHTYSFLK